MRCLLLHWDICERVHRVNKRLYLPLEYLVYAIVQQGRAAFVAFATTNNNILTTKINILTT